MLLSLLDYLKCDIKNTVKTLIYKADGKLYAVLVRGDRVVNETKLSILLNVADVELSSLEEDMAVTHAEVGFAGPIGLEIPVIVDLEVNDMVNYIAGANKTGYHYLNVNNRFVNVETKYQDGKLLIVIRNSKNPERNPDLKTTKGDKRRHGRGLRSVRRVAEQYGGNLLLEDEGDTFKASLLLTDVACLE